MKLTWCVPLLVAMLSGCMGTESDPPNPKLNAPAATGGNFGQTLIGVSKQITFTLVNDGSGFTKVETLRDIVISVSGPGLTKDSQDCHGTLGENESCAIVVTYDPNAAGALAGQLQVASNADASPLTLNLTGTATLTPNPAVGAVQVSDTPSRQFEVAKGSTLTRVYTLSNRGNAADTLAITGPGASVTDWVLSHDCQDPLPATTGSCQLTVTYQPGNNSVAGTQRVVVEDAYNKDYGQLVIEFGGIPQ